MISTALEKVWFPAFIVSLQILMLILFGTLVEYDDVASPVTTNDSSAIPNSDGDTQTFYPRKCTWCGYFFFFVSTGKMASAK